MTIYKVSRYVKGESTNGEWRPAGTNYYSTKRKANAKIDNEISFERDNVRGIKTQEMSARFRSEILYFKSGAECNFVMSAIEVE